MELLKKQWTKENIKEFNNFLQTLKNANKTIWTQKIYATAKPCLAIKVPVLREIAKQINNGNVEQFLKNQTRKYIEDDIIFALLINFCKNYEQQKKLVLEFLKNVDSWVCTDTIKIDKRANFDCVLKFSKKLITKKELFLRRFAFVQLLKYAKNKQCIGAIFELIEKCVNEKEYYVNMAICWLICEICIYFPENTENFLINYKNTYKNDNNMFVLKKSISKCCDSFRIDNNLKIKLKSLIKNI